MNLRAVLALIVLELGLISWGACPRFKYDWIVGFIIGGFTYALAQHFIWNHS